MKIINSIDYRKLRDKYDLLIGFVDEFIEFEHRYSLTEYRLDYLVSHSMSRIDGVATCGLKIFSLQALYNKVSKINNENIIFIIYSNKEYIIEDEIYKFFPNADIVVSRLIIHSGIRQHSFSRDCEDLFIMTLINKLGFTNNMSYIDIGVCHPVVRNNTFMLYENNFFNGILVEPNPLLSKYIEEYRPKNKLLQCGAGTHDCHMQYVSSVNDVLPGHNFFATMDYEIDYRKHKRSILPIFDINKILSVMTDEPLLIDIDAEGMDLALLKSINFSIYNFKIICIEPGRGGRLHLNEMKTYLNQCGYTHFINTLENALFIKKEYIKKI